MRTVLYADSDLEPITVIDLPGWAMQRLRHGEQIHFAVMLPLEAMTVPITENCAEMVRTPTVTVWVEKFRRRGREHLFLFTNDEVNALLMECDFLPGQQAELGRQRKEAFIEGMLSAISRLE